MFFAVHVNLVDGVVSGAEQNVLWKEIQHILNYGKKGSRSVSNFKFQ